MKINIEKLGFAICDEAKEYYNKKESFEQAWKECHRGYWMLFFAGKIGVDLPTLILAKALCVKTVLHLMKDQRSVNGVLVAEKYGRGEATYEELKDASDDASDAYLDADSADAAAAYAATNAADYISAYMDSYAPYSAARAVTCAAIAADDALKNQQKTADICREILTEKVFEKLKIITNEN